MEPAKTLSVALKGCRLELFAKPRRMITSGWEARLGRVRMFVWVISVGLVASACTPSSPSATANVTTTSSNSPGSTTPTTTEPSETVPFPEFIATIGEELLRRNPELVTELGIDSLLDLNSDQLSNLSFAYRAKTTAIAAEALASLDAYSLEDLESDEIASAEILRWLLEDITSLSAFADHAYAVNYITGAHTLLPEFLADVHPIDNTDDAEAYVARLQAAGDQMRQVADNLARSEAAGILATENGLQIAGYQIGEVLQPAADHPLVTDLIERMALIEGVTDEGIASIRTAAVSAVEDGLLPGYADLLSAVEDTTSRTDSSPGVGELPRGHDYYAAILKHHVSADVTPADVHQLGLDNVGRLVEEISPVVTELGFDPTDIGFERALAEASAEAGFFPLSDEASKEEVLALATQEVEAAQETFAPMFEQFPESPLLVVRPRPGREAGAGAYYIPPPAIGSRPGLYYLSLGGQGLPRQTFTTTNHHEAIPGHHFQLAIQRESQDLPLLQRATQFNGYAEGWGLYAERLAYEAGVYDDDPHGNLGRLRMELLRAARVVADTGIHANGWSRSEAIGYMTDLGFPQGWASNEVDRYIVWPGQAPAYLIGMLEILRLRDEAMDALGPNFDLAAFHTEVLRHGSVPLAVLDSVVARYIEENS